MYKMYCEVCDTRFSITDQIIDKLIDDADFLLKCPICKSLEIHLLEVAGQKTGY